MREVRRLEIADAWWLEVAAESKRLEQASRLAASDPSEPQAEEQVKGSDAADLTES